MNPIANGPSSLERIVENLSTENTEIKSSIVDITYSYVLTEPDVPDHVKKNVRCLRELYSVTEAIGEQGEEC